MGVKIDTSNHNKSLKPMIKIRIIIISITFSICLQTSMAQSTDIDIEACGKNDNPALNQEEADYFNLILKEHRGDFDFEGKRVAFALGNWGASLRSKRDYFERDGKPRFEQNSTIANQLILLSEAEKVILPEYDAIVVSWSKLTIEKRKRLKLVKVIAKRFSKTPKSI